MQQAFGEMTSLRVMHAVICKLQYLKLMLQPGYQMRLLGILTVLLIQLPIQRLHLLCKLGLVSSQLLQKDTQRSRRRVGSLCINCSPSHA